MLTKEFTYTAALASQTLFGKPGSTSREAFSGSAGSSPTSVGQGHGKGKRGSEKVHKVLKGTMVVRVVDVELVPRGPIAGGYQAHRGCNRQAGCRPRREIHVEHEPKRVWDKDRGGCVCAAAGEYAELDNGKAVGMGVGVFSVVWVVRWWDAP
ncbi:hypothetical protein BV22DRAFT_1135617 [Leucogyrophana mollusca]|uniref:Uncharacterized protein n=1 Tax=Leucogyrophana mollusca TaxID=85980 RepID=A0ACB8AUY4_9AGAM|nr:hypothetical protein BV22DRAFT_1135617 [Leucogyrophana mollusca]